MGCCCSKETHEDDDINAPLLGNEVHTDSRMNYQALETIDVKQEQEFWNDVIDRTTQNLIDISNSQADPLQEQDIQARMDKYHDLLEQIPYSTIIKKQRSSFHHGKSIGLTTGDGYTGNGTAYNGLSEEMTNSLAAATTPSTASAMTGGSPHHFDVDSSTIDSLLSTIPLSQEQIEWLDQAVLDIDQALQKIEVQPVGDIVIHLTMPDSGSYQSY